MSDSVNKEHRSNPLEQGVFPFMSMDDKDARAFEEAAEKYMFEAQSFYNEWLSKSPEEIEAYVRDLRAYQLKIADRFLPKKRSLLDALFSTFFFSTSQSQQYIPDSYNGFAEDARNLCMDGRQVAITFAIATLSQAAHSE